MKTNIGERIKRYEQAYNHSLTPRSVLMIRVDGRAFHTYCRGRNRPFDDELIEGMATAARKTAREMQGFKLAYIQSDEATFMLTDFDTHETQGWFNYELNKIVSISASAFTAYFNQFMGVDEVAMFDSRAFIVPVDDAPNVFVWRQRDWERNSLQMLARSHYSQPDLENKNTADLHELLFKEGVNWANLESKYKNGTFITKDFQTIHDKLSYETIYELALLGVGDLK